MERNSSTRSSNRASNQMMQSIPTLGDSVSFSPSDNKVDKNEPAPRIIKVNGQSNLKIEFDIDMGLLMQSIPSQATIDEEEPAAVWDWEQQFSQLNAEFSQAKKIKH